jgi:hypothetical protein
LVPGKILVVFTNNGKNLLVFHGTNGGPILPICIQYSLDSQVENRYAR